jgi:hypothetical protein
MRLLNELREVRIASGRREVDGVIRVRGIDLTADGRGVMLARHEPVAVIVREAGAIERVSLAPHAMKSSALIAIVGAPIVARVIARLMSSRRSG